MCPTVTDGSDSHWSTRRQPSCAGLFAIWEARVMSALDMRAWPGDEQTLLTRALGPST